MYASIVAIQPDQTVHTADIQLTYTHLFAIISPMSKKLKSYRFDENTINLIDELKKSLHLENNSAVIRRAITLLKLANDAKASGGTMVIRDEDGDKELIL